MNIPDGIPRLRAAPPPTSLAAMSPPPPPPLPPPPRYRRYNETDERTPEVFEDRLARCLKDRSAAPKGEGDVERSLR